MTENGRDFVDFTVVVGLGQDVAEALTVGAVSDVVACSTGVEDTGKGRDANLAGRSEEAVTSIVVGVNEADGHPVGVLVQVLAELTGEGVALDQQSNTGEAFAVVAHGDLAGHFCAGVVLQNLDQGVGRLNLILRRFAVPVGNNVVVHHGPGQRKCVGHDGAWRAGLAEVLGRLWVAGACVETER